MDDDGVPHVAEARRRLDDATASGDSGRVAGAQVVLGAPRRPTSTPMTAYTIADDHEAVETVRNALNVLRGRFT